MPGPSLRQVVRRKPGKIFEGVDELVAVFGRREDAVARETNDCTCEGEAVEEEDCADEWPRVKHF